MLHEEFERQVENLMVKGYPEVVGLTAAAFKKELEPLKHKISEIHLNQIESQSSKIPFVIVIKSDWLHAERAMQLVEREGKNGFSVMDVEEINRFQPIEGIGLPEGRAYLLLDIDTGTGTLNVTPTAALASITQENRSPLTIEEGISVITHFPEVLRKNNGFSLLGSRCGDRRVTALWISDKKPKLGWCWAGNPHTWLGSASCRARC
ncbi:DUF5701 family protein [Paenibacillus sp. Soil750]|uniref:DUF5701 family protein n=1 Tax=Paenibacillus sp. Soil750 TaxID=1736398 RepID=UPI0006F7F9B4|nr:DUF5701 family protein [Paenibacillus sp. Soil750]KRE69991.1 hypothetical protein ASL11_16680 [Paenibacillus sp. Soil750]